MALLACGGVGLGYYVVFGALWLAPFWMVRALLYYAAGRTLARSHPELGRGPVDLAALRVSYGFVATVATAAFAVGALFTGSFGWLVATILLTRTLAWLLYARFVVVPRVPMAAAEQAAWAAGLTVVSVLFDVATGSAWFLVATIPARL